MKTEPGYEPVAGVLQEALDQAQHGKGRIRHANDKPFMEQPIMEEARNSGPGFLSGQIRKKILEAKNCPDDERAIADLLGAIVYTVAMVLERRERQGAPEKVATTEILYHHIILGDTPLTIEWLRANYPYKEYERVILLVPRSRRKEVLALRGASERSEAWGIGPPKNVFAAVGHVFFGYLESEEKTLRKEAPGRTEYQEMVVPQMDLSYIAKACGGIIHATPMGPSLELDQGGVEKFKQLFSYSHSQ